MFFFYNLSSPNQEKQSAAGGSSCPITLENESDQWSVYVDGSSAQEGVGAGILLIRPDNEEFHYCIKFMFSITNNAVEYEALLACPRLAKKIRVGKLTVFIDS